MNTTQQNARLPAKEDTMARPSLRSINKETGTSFRRWKEVTAVVKEAREDEDEAEALNGLPVLSEAEIEEVEPTPEVTRG